MPAGPPRFGDVRFVRWTGGGSGQQSRVTTTEVEQAAERQYFARLTLTSFSFRKIQFVADIVGFWLESFAPTKSLFKEKLNVREIAQ